MKITVRQLRRVIRETIEEMKLGIASANPPGEAWGHRNDDEEHSRNVDDLGRLIATTTVGAFEDPEGVLSTQNQMNMQHANQLPDWEDEEEELEYLAPLGYQRKRRLGKPESFGDVTIGIGHGDEDVQIGECEEEIVRFKDADAELTPAEQAREQSKRRSPNGRPADMSLAVNKENLPEASKLLKHLLQR